MMKLPPSSESTYRRWSHARTSSEFEHYAGILRGASNAYHALKAFEDWDQLADTAKTWIELRRLIQEAFKRRLNATAPTAGHQGYAPALPFQQNAFGALAGNDSDEDDSAETGGDTDGGTDVSESADR